MAYFVGVQTFDPNGRLCFDSNRRWVRFVDKIVMKDQENTGSRTYQVPYGSIIVSPFSLNYQGVSDPIQVWRFSVSGNTVSWYRWGASEGWVRPKNDTSMAFVMWVD